MEHASGIARQMVGRWGMSPAIEECYEQALATLRGSRDRLDRLARALLDRETLEEDEAYAAAGVAPAAPRPRSPAAKHPVPPQPPSIRSLLPRPARTTSRLPPAGKAGPA